MSILTIFSILAWGSMSWSLAKYLKTNFVAGLFFTACCITLCLFFGLLVGELRASYYLIVAIALAHALLRGGPREGVRSYVAEQLANGPSLSKTHFPIYLLGGGLLLFFGFKVAPDFAFFGWDEFSHWARYSKLLVETSQAQASNDAILFPTYPPGINLWHYYICGPNGYLEWKVVFAQALLVVTAIGFISTGINKRASMTALPIFAIVFALYYGFGANLYDLYTDGILGLFFAASLLLAKQLNAEDFNFKVFIFFLIVLLMMSLIKPIAPLFSLTATGLFACLALYKFLASKLKSSPEKRVKILPIISQTIGGIAASFLVAWIWRRYTAGAGVSDAYADTQSLSFSSITEFFFTRNTEETQIAWAELWARIGFEPTSPYGGDQFVIDYSMLEIVEPTVMGALALMVTGAVIFGMRALFNLRQAFVPVVEYIYLALTFILYTSLILFITRHFFQIYDIERLASLERYLSSFLLGILAYGSSRLILEFKAPYVGDQRNVTQGALLLVGATLFFNAVYAAPKTMDTLLFEPLAQRGVPAVHPWANEYDELVEIRGQIKELSTVAKNYAKGDDKIYVIAQNETGYTFYITGHELSPLATNKGCFSVGPLYAKNDVWTCDYDLQLVLDVEGYDYVLIRRADEQFWDQYGTLFEDDANGFKAGFFEVDRSGDKVRLKTLYLSNTARGIDSES